MLTKGGFGASASLSNRSSASVGKGLAWLGVERDELLGGGDDVFIRKDGGAVGFHTEGVDQQRIIGEVDYCAEGHAGNA